MSQSQIHTIPNSEGGISLSTLNQLPLPPPTWSLGLSLSLSFHCNSSHSVTTLCSDPWTQSKTPPPFWFLKGGLHVRECVIQILIGILHGTHPVHRIQVTCAFSLFPRPLYLGHSFSYTSFFLPLRIASCLVLSPCCHGKQSLWLNRIVSLEDMQEPPVVIQMCLSRASPWVTWNSFPRRYRGARSHIWVISCVSLVKLLNLSVSHCLL